MDDADSTSNGMSGMGPGVGQEGTLPGFAQGAAVQAEAVHAAAEGRSAPPAQAQGVAGGAGRVLPTAASGAEGADATPEGRPLSVAIRERL